MRPPRAATFLVFAAMLPQLTGCTTFHAVSLRSLPKHPQAVRASEKIRVETRNGDRMTLSGPWVRGDTLWGVSGRRSRAASVGIPARDIKKLGHREISPARTVLVGIPLALVFLAFLVDASTGPVTIKGPTIW